MQRQSWGPATTKLLALSRAPSHFRGHTHQLACPPSWCPNGVLWYLQASLSSALPAFISEYLGPIAPCPGQVSPSAQRLKGSHYRVSPCAQKAQGFSYLLTTETIKQFSCKALWQQQDFKEPNGRVERMVWSIGYPYIWDLPRKQGFWTILGASRPDHKRVEAVAHPGPNLPGHLPQ